MPETALDKDVNYVLSFVQIESLKEKIQFDTKVFNIINVFYHDQPLPEAAECSANGAMLDTVRLNTALPEAAEDGEDGTLRLVIPRIATYLGNTFGTDETFKSVFCTKGTSEAIGDFKIKGEQYTLLANRSFDGVIKFLKTQKFDNNYKNHFDRCFLYFVIQFKCEDNIKRVYEILGDGLFRLKYNDVDKTISTPCHNRIVFGAPGTGKSWKINKESAIFKNNITRVTFHPEYSYFDFVGSYKPVMRDVAVKNDVNGQTQTTNERKIEYDFVPGPFAYILRKALEHPYASHCLIIEEINRARVAAVFGDIFQLLDRNKSGESEYEIMPSLELARYLQNNPTLADDKITPIRIPNNLYIWATMNSADQGVYPLDTAFKRRWSMEYLDINAGAKDDGFGWNTFRKGINNLLKPHVNEDKLMGYYFLKEEERDTETHLEEALKGKVLMYLFDDAAKACRKSVFKEINGGRTYSDLRDHMSLKTEGLGIFAGGAFEYISDDTWDKIRKGINKLLLEKGHVNEDKLMGYYFLKEEERTGDKLKDALQNKVLMYLFDDAAKPCRKEIFIEGKQTFSELRDACNMKENNLGIFEADVWNAPQG